MVPEGSHVGQPMHLRDWQADIIRGIYDADVRQAIVSMGRKNAKTALISMLLLAHLAGPIARRNSQIYSSALSREQAAIVFGYAAKMVRMNADLSHIVHCRDSGKELFCNLTGVKYRALSADASTAYGLSPVFAVHDELGQIKAERSELYDAIETAMGAHDRPLSVVISTQAASDRYLLSQLIDDAIKAGDPSTALFLFAAAEDDNPFAEATWRKANPALGDFLSLAEFNRLADRAKRSAVFEATFRNLHLNQRCEAENSLISEGDWKACSTPPETDHNRPWFAGLDLSERADLTALILVSPTPDGAYDVVPFFWLPADDLLEKSRQDKVPYDVWARQGRLLTVPGRSISYRHLVPQILAVFAKFNITRVNYDNARVKPLFQEFRDVGCNVGDPDPQNRLERLINGVVWQDFRQGFISMAPAVDKLESVVLNHQLRHGNHPILAWNAANAVVADDPAGNRKFDKRRSRERIDGIVALAMALMATVGREKPRAAAPMAVWI